MLTDLKDIRSSVAAHLQSFLQVLLQRHVFISSSHGQEAQSDLDGCQRLTDVAERLQFRHQSRRAQGGQGLLRNTHNKALISVL